MPVARFLIHQNRAYRPRYTARTSLGHCRKIHTGDLVVRLLTGPKRAYNPLAFAAPRV